MLAGPRLASSEFSVFTYTKLENSDLESLDFPTVDQNKEVFVRDLQSLSFRVSPIMKPKTFTDTGLGPCFK